MGSDPSKISFSQIAKPKSEIIESYNLGVKLTLVDSIEEVEKIASIKDKVKDLKLLIRYQSNDPEAEYSLGGRFGADEDEIEEKLNYIHKNGLNFAGTHFHIGTGVHNPAAFKNGIRIAKETIEKGRKLGYKPSIVDIGGGFCQEVEIDQFVKVILFSIKEYFLEDMKIIAEPGRFIAANSLSYVANVLYKHKKVRKNLCYYSLDDVIHENMAFYALFNKIVKCIPLNPKGTKKIKNIIGG